MRFPLLHPGLSNLSIRTDYSPAFVIQYLSTQFYPGILTSLLTKLYFISLSSLWLNIISRTFLQMVFLSVKRIPISCLKFQTNKIKQEKSSFLIWHTSLLFHRYKSCLFLNKSSFYFSDIKLTSFWTHTPGMRRAFDGHSLWCTWCRTRHPRKSPSDPR